MNIKYINSLQNPLIKDLKKSCCRAQQKKQTSFIAEGQEIITKALKNNWKLHNILFDTKYKDDQDIIKILNIISKQGINIIETEHKILQAICNKENPAKIIASFEKKFYKLNKLQITKTKNFLALDRVRDPGNLGSIIRSCEAFGLEDLILIGDCVHCFNIESVRASMGSIFAIKTYLTSEKEIVEFCKNNNIYIIGTSLNKAKDFRDINYNKKNNLIIMGNESHGISSTLTKYCDILVKIPQKSNLNSLNLSVATAIMLFHAQQDIII